MNEEEKIAEKVRMEIAIIRNRVALESIERETHPIFYNEELARRRLYAKRIFEVLQRS